MRGSYMAVAVIVALAVFYAGLSTAPSISFAEPQISSEDGKTPTSVTVIAAAEARGILGREVRSAADENMGRIVDVVVDRAGQVRASIIDFGGFLGVGSRKIAVDWNALRFTHVANKGDSIILELTREQVKAAPEYKEGKPIVVLGPSGSLEPLRFVAPLKPEK
jgi:hypothetical protein